ncbi:MAG: hypothetical protein FJX18_04055, partial [Alphaproteobacteria bacterium]|nr:hypothetical protein [Alphaproteobacteria bacterium]
MIFIQSCHIFCFGLFLVIAPAVSFGNWVDSLSSAMKTGVDDVGKGVVGIGKGIGRVGGDALACMNQASNPMAQMDPSFMQKCAPYLMGMNGMGMGGMMGGMGG